MVPSAVGQTSSVTLAWDANPEPFVTGYIVYVGNESGRYREQYDAGRTTSFVYRNVVPGRPYYFAVAAYASTQTVGPRSAEVVFQIDTIVAPAWTRATTTASATRDAVCPAGGGCYTANRVATVPGDASSIAVATDGRILFIHDQTSIRIIDGAGLITEPALTADSPEVTFADLVLDSEFVRNRVAYVAEVVTRADRRRELSIARYREVAHVFGERAVIVAGLPMSSSGTAALALDSAHRLYVALPADRYSSDPYAGMVLRFERDGSVPDQNRARSPVFARGYAGPASLEWDAARTELWLSGTGTGETPTIIARLSVNDRNPASNAVSAGTGAGNVVLIDKVTGVVRINSGTDRAPAAELIWSSDLGGDPTSAASRDGDIYLSLIVAGPNSSPTSQILRLRRD